MTTHKHTLWIGIGIAIVVVLLLGSVGYKGMMNGWNGELVDCCDFEESVSTTSVGAPAMMRDFSLREVGSPMMAYNDSVIASEQTAGLTAAEVDQKVIKTGYLDLQVGDVAESTSKIIAYTTGHGGFTQDSETNEREDGSHYGNITVRLPSDTFESAMDEIASYATLVQTRSSQGQDVTEQYADLEARLSNAEAQEQEYLKILQQATSVEDILNVQQYLGQVRQEIESYQGQIKYLSNQTSYSTISISLSEASSVHLPTKAFRPLDIIKDAVQGLGAIGQGVVEGVIYLVIIGGGILLPIGLIAWGVVTALRRRHKK